MRRPHHFALRWLLQPFLESAIEAVEWLGTRLFPHGWCFCPVKLSGGSPCNFSLYFIFILLLGCLNGTLNFWVDLFLLRFRVSEKDPFFSYLCQGYPWAFWQVAVCCWGNSWQFWRRRQKTVTILFTSKLTVPFQFPVVKARGSPGLISG